MTDLHDAVTDHLRHGLAVSIEIPLPVELTHDLVPWKPSGFTAITDDLWARLHPGGTPYTVELLHLHTATVSTRRATTEHDAARYGAIASLTATRYRVLDHVSVDTSIALAPPENYLAAITDAVSPDHARAIVNDLHPAEHYRRACLDSARQWGLTYANCLFGVVPSIRQRATGDHVVHALLTPDTPAATVHATAAFMTVFFERIVPGATAELLPLDAANPQASLTAPAWARAGIDVLALRRPQPNPS